MPSTSSTQAAQSPAPSPPGRKPKRWRRRIFFALLIALAVGAPLLNGPVFRKAVHWQLGKFLEKNQLTGDFKVAGTLLGGLELREVEITGTRELRSLTFTHAMADYHLTTLVRGDWGKGISRLHASGIDLRLDRSQHAREKPAKDRKAEPEVKSEFWENLDALLESDLKIADLDLAIVADGELSLSLTGLDFQLLAGEGSVTADQVTLPNGQTSRDLDARLTSAGAPLLQIESLILSDAVTVDRLTVAPPAIPGALPRIDGECLAFGGELRATQESPTRWAAQLTGGAIDLAAVRDWLDLAPALAGLVDRLEAGIESDGEDLVVRADLGTRELAYDTYRADSAAATLSFDRSAEQLEIHSFEAQSGTATATASGGYSLKTRDLAGTAEITAPDLAALTRAQGLAPLAGSLAGNAELQIEAGKLHITEGQLSATDLSYRGATIASGTLGVTGDKFALTARLPGDKDDTVGAEGTFDLESLSYEADATIELKPLADAQPFLELAGIEHRPTGSLDLTWSGSGSLDKQSHRGTAKVHTFDVRLNDEGTPVVGKFDLGYAPGNFRLTELSARSDQLSVTGTANLADGRLKVEGLRLFNDARAIARADVSLPFDPETLDDLDRFLDQPGDISAEIESDQLQLADLMAMAGQPVSLAARLDAKIDVRGTLADPTGNGTVDILDLRSATPSDFAPLDTHLKFALGDGQIKLDGKLEHPDIQPITILGHTPLRPRKMASIEDQSIDLSFHFPETDLGIATEYLPQLATATGKASADLRLSGSLGDPQLSGDLRLESPLVKFKGQKFSTISDLDIDLRLEGDQMRVESCRAFVAGGEITVGGTAGLADLTNPQLELSLAARQALVLRDDNISLRSNADLKLTGPFEQAALTGKIGLTQSRFFREIEILPIGLPSSSPTPAAPEAPSFAARREIGVAARPFANWTLDVRVITDDPFLIRSNLARGEVTSDLSIGGTLGNPVPDGAIRLDRGAATLPFSDLETDRGTLTFSETTGFDPEINFRARSKVQDYNISVLAYGRLSDPKTLITSDPPLPENEAVSLLATGVKSSDLNNSEVIAGEAALLLIDKLQRKYAKGTPLERRPGGLRDVLDFEAGQIDPRTGKRSASAELEVTERVFLLGNVDVEGDYRGLVKFIFRFD